ncbi:MULTISPECIES: hypothetical protein [unclassified Mycobacterium]|uniref:hypothetical protein n=1 Tax=unclassified Mycobacterium TaxID=2642494 RepID=UPI001115A7EC|nr:MULTISPECIES: hypothetical protein [unclassified Mycobacterium]
MTITRGIAAAVMLAGSAVGTASNASADTTMSGHYIMTETYKDGRPVTNDWDFTPCGDGCASLVSNGIPIGRARLVNGQWISPEAAGDIHCPDGTVVPNASSAHMVWDPNTLAGIDQITLTVPACGAPAGYQYDRKIQLTQAP